MGQGLGSDAAPLECAIVVGMIFLWFLSMKSSMRLQRFSAFYAPWMALILVFPLAIAQSQTTYYGKLDGRLHIDPDASNYAIWDEGTPADAIKLGVPLKEKEHLFKGQITLAAQLGLKFDGAVVEFADGTDALYLDLNRDGRFEENERFVLQPVTDHSHDKWTKSRVRIDVPLASGFYKSCPMDIQLINSDAPRVPPGKRVIVYARQEFVEGYAQLPDRTLLMRFEYNFEKNAIDLDHHLEWVDINGDGKIDTSPGSMEALKAIGKPPVFRVGKLLLSVQTVDLATNTFVLRTVSPEEYSRIDLAVGSTLPDFAFTDFSGKNHRLSEIKARYLLLDFWKTTCAPCVADLPSKVKVYEEFHHRGFEILGMDGMEESLEKPQKLLAKYNIAWPQAQYEKDLFDNKFQIILWPTLVLIDERHKIVSTGNAKYLPLDGENLSRTLHTLMQDN
jgi:thiol-disulfide isomerase/thioredoxin